MKICIDCGAEFKRSPADATVRCPDCRASSRKAAPAPSRYLLRAAEAKRAAYAARKRGDTEAYEKALAELQYFRAMGARI